METDNFIQSYSLTAPFHHSSFALDLDAMLTEQELLHKFLMGVWVARVRLLVGM